MPAPLSAILRPLGPDARPAYVVRDNGCWEWQGKLHAEGYGRRLHHGRHTMVHRAAYEDMVGPVPDGLCLDHLCGNRRCVNPAHLEPVTAAENNRRGRNARLTTEIVAALRADFAAGGISRRQLAEKYGLTYRWVLSIVRGDSWAAPAEWSTRRRKGAAAA